MPQPLKKGRVILGLLTPIMENQLEKKMETEMETGVIQGLHWHCKLEIVIMEIVRIR